MAKTYQRVDRILPGEEELTPQQIEAEGLEEADDSMGPCDEEIAELGWKLAHGKIQKAE